MSALGPQMNGGGPQQLPDGTVLTDPVVVTNALLNALHQVARSAASASHSGAEAKDFADAALKLSQAVVVLDPTLSQGGTPLDHDMALRALDGETQARVAEIQRAAQVDVERVRGEYGLKSAKERAAAPTPARRAEANP